MNRSVAQKRFGVAVAASMAAALVATLALAACTPRIAAPAESDVQAPHSRVTWDPAALRSAMPGLVGWRAGRSGPGALVSISPDSSPTVIWEAPSLAGASLEALAIDSDGSRVLCVEQVDGTGEIVSLAMLREDGSVEELPMPDGNEGVIGAAFVRGRPVVAVYHGTSDRFTTTLGTYTSDGVWQPIMLEGDLPEYQFVERLMSVPGTDTVALVLKTPGGPGERDDEALVLANLTDLRLATLSGPFRDDALVAAAPLWGRAGVAYPRNPRAGAAGPVVDLIVAEWTGDRWVERVVATDAPFATGIETGDVVAQDQSGVYWLRSAATGPHGGEQVLLRYDPARGIETGVARLADIDWFVWAQPAQ